MPNYFFSARDVDGAGHSGVLAAGSESLLSEELRRRGWLILDLRPAHDARRAQTRQRTFEWPFRGPRSLDIEASLRQLALMERSGLPLLTALRTAAEYARRPSMGRVWQRVAERIEAGSTLAAALEAEPRTFPPLARELVRAGESSGALELAFQRSSEHFEQRRAIRASLFQALFYPSIVLFLALLVASFMVFKVVPVLETFMQTSRRQLPPLTQGLVSVSHYLRFHLPQLAVAALALVGLGIALDRWPPSRRVIDACSYRLPLVGTLRRLASTAVFARSLSVLGMNGIDIVRSLTLCEGILVRPIAASEIERARQRVLAGDSLAEGLAGARAFVPILARMVAVGEKSGTLDVVLADVAGYHEGELRLWIRRASALIEPIVTIVVGVIVGVVYIAFFLAVFAAAGAAG